MSPPKLLKRKGKLHARARTSNGQKIALRYVCLAIRGDETRWNIIRAQCFRGDQAFCCFNFANLAQTKCPDSEQVIADNPSLSPTLPAQELQILCFSPVINRNGALSLAPLHKLFPETPLFAERLAVC
jgi:hypothetical protein